MLNTVINCYCNSGRVLSGVKQSELHKKDLFLETSM